MEQIQADYSTCTQNSDDELQAFIEDTIQETSRLGQMEIQILENTTFQTQEDTTIQTNQSDSTAKSSVKVSSLLIDEICTEACYQSENENGKLLPTAKSQHKLDVFTSQAQSTGSFHPTDPTGGITRSRKGMHLNDPQAFNEPPEMHTSIDIAPILPKLGCSTPSFVARLKQRVAEKGERFVSEVVLNATVANSSISEAPAYDQPGNTSSPNDHSNVNAVDIEKTQSVIKDSGDVSIPEKEATKDYLAPCWEEESTFRTYTTFPVVVESRTFAENLMPTSDPDVDADADPDDQIDQLQFTNRVLPISSTRMLDTPDMGYTFPEPSAAFEKTYSGVELEILGGPKEGFNDGSSDEDDILEIHTPIYRVVSRSQNKAKATKKAGFLGRMFGRVAKQISKIKAPTTLTRESLESSVSTVSPSMEGSVGSTFPKKVKKRTVRNPGDAVTFSKTLN